MFENLQSLWQMMQAGAVSPDPNLAATQLAQLGDPDAIMAPLFSDAKQWSPVNMGQDMQVPQPANPMEGFAGMMNPTAPPQPIPQGPAPIEDRGTMAGQQDADRARMMDRRNELTSQQYKELMGMMPDQKGYVPPAPGVVAPRGLSGNMQMLEAGQRQMPRRVTLGDLIYGGR